MKKSSENSARVAFQGEPGAFSEAAVARLFPEAVTVPCKSFDDLFAAVPRGLAEYALVPLENTLAGHIAACYELLYLSELSIHGEVVLPIHHCLIGCAGATVEGLRAVQSHPVALEQCENFFRQHPHIERTVAADTAGSVRDVIERGDPSVAAIAGEHAARVYSGAILRRNLEDFPENFTRFALLSRGVAAGGGDKWSLVVKLKHQPGGLCKALEPFARHHINLLNLVCRPIKGRPWEYQFFIDLSVSGAEGSMTIAMMELEKAVDELRVLGTYKSAKTGDRD